MKFGQIGAIALLATLMTLPLGTTARAETELRALSAWATTLPLVPDVFYKFQEIVAEKTGGELVFKNVGPEAVAPFEQFEPLSQGVFDIEFQSAAYHQAQTGMGVVLHHLIDLDPEKLRPSGMMDWLNDYYRKNFGVIIISTFESGPTTFVLTKPLEGDTMLTGRKIRSNASYEGIVRALGATPVAMSAAEAYIGMEKGTLDGVAWPASFTADFKLYEVAKYMTTPNFSQSSIMILMNAAKFDALPKEQQDAIMEAGKEIDRVGTAYGEAQVNSQKQIMLDNGVQLTEFSPEIAEKIAEVDTKAAIEIARRSQPEAVDAALKYAEEHGVLVKH